MNRILLYILWVAVILYYVGNVYYTQKYATGGVELFELRQQITDLKAQNSILKEQILKESSLSRIEQKARQQGWVDASYLYLHL